MDLHAKPAAPPLAAGGGDARLSRARDYARIANALDYVSAHHFEQPELAAIAAEVGLSEYHFQRLFTRWAGVSPKKFLQYVTLEHAKRSLEAAASVLDAAYDAGLSGPGRLHDLFVTCEAVTPGEYKTRGAGLTLRYGFHASPFGECLLLLSERGVSGLSFVVDDDREAALAEQTAGWEAARLEADPEATAPLIERVFGRTGGAPATGPPLKLLLRGTRFQVKVWEALLRVPPGALTTYDRIAERIGSGKGAAQAIGRALGANPIGYLIPCHRVIRASGVIGGYRWGRTRKMALIGWEAARAEASGAAA